MLNLIFAVFDYMKIIMTAVDESFKLWSILASKVKIRFFMELIY